MEKLFKKIHFASTIIKTNFIPARLPYKLIYVVTKECHSKCTNCQIWKVQPKNELRIEEIEKFAANSGFLSWLNLTGGEPTDRKDLTEIISCFKYHCPHLALVNFPTNGINQNRIVETCQKIARLELPKFVVNVSLDGPPDINDKLRGIKNDFNLALSTYKELKKIKGVQTFLSMTLYPDNMHFIDETVQLVQHQVPRFKRGDLHLNIAHTSDHFYENQKQSPIVHRQLTSVSGKEIERRGIPVSPFQLLDYIYQKKIRNFIESGLTPVPCTAGQSSFYLSEIGEVFPCTIWGKSLGNIRQANYSLLKILENKTLIEETRKQISSKDCPNCWSPCEAAQSIAGNLTDLKTYLYVKTKQSDGYRSIPDPLLKNESL